MGDLKYGHVTTEKKELPPDEPVFILRAKDAAALATLAHYHNICRQLGAPPEHLHDVQTVLGRFQKWALEHGTKIPD